MFDAKKLLDALVGSAAAGGGSKQNEAGLGGMLNDVLGQLTGGAAAPGGQKAPGDAGGLAGKAAGYLKTPQGNIAASAVVGGLAGLLMGSKSGRKLAGSAAKVGGLALIGGLAYMAYRNWQAGQTPAASANPQPGAGVPVLPPPAQSPFSVETASQDTALVLLRAMIAAAAADGHVDPIERGRIIGGLKQAGFDIEATQFLDHEFANPAPITRLASAGTTPELASEIYTAARLTIEPDTFEEKTFLAQLGDALGLEKELIAHIDAAATAAKA